MSRSHRCRVVLLLATVAVGGCELLARYAPSATSDGQWREVISTSFDDEAELDIWDDSYNDQYYYFDSAGYDDDSALRINEVRGQTPAYLALEDKVLGARALRVEFALKVDLTYGSDPLLDLFYLRSEALEATVGPAIGLMLFDLLGKPTLSLLVVYDDESEEIIPISSSLPTSWTKVVIEAFAPSDVDASDGSVMVSIDEQTELLDIDNDLTWDTLFRLELGIVDCNAVKGDIFLDDVKIRAQP